MGIQIGQEIIELYKYIPFFLLKKCDFDNLFINPISKVFFFFGRNSLNKVANVLYWVPLLCIPLLIKRLRMWWRIGGEGISLEGEKKVQCWNVVFWFFFFFWLTFSRQLLPLKYSVEYS